MSLETGERFKKEEVAHSVYFLRQTGKISLESTQPVSLAESKLQKPLEKFGVSRERKLGGERQLCRSVESWNRVVLISLGLLLFHTDFLNQLVNFH